MQIILPREIYQFIVHLSGSLPVHVVLLEECLEYFGHYNFVPFHFLSHGSSVVSGIDSNFLGSSYLEQITL